MTLINDKLLYLQPTYYYILHYYTVRLVVWRSLIGQGAKQLGKVLKVLGAISDVSR